MLKQPEAFTATQHTYTGLPSKTVSFMDRCSGAGFDSSLVCVERRTAHTHFKGYDYVTLGKTFLYYCTL